MFDTFERHKLEFTSQVTSEENEDLTIAVWFALSFIQSTQAQSTNFIDILLGASPIAKGVLILLLVFSIYSWAIIITKWMWLRDAEKHTNHGEE